MIRIKEKIKSRLYKPPICLFCQLLTAIWSIVIFSFNLTAQNFQDSLIQEIKKQKKPKIKAEQLFYLSRGLMTVSVDSAIYYGQLASELDQSNPEFQADIAIWLSSCFAQKGMLDKALEMGLKGSRHAEKSKTLNDDFKSDLWLAEFYSESMNNIPKGLEYARNALSIAESNHNVKNLVLAQQRLAGVYGVNSYNMAEAEKYIRLAYKNVLKLRDTTLTIDILSHLAAICRETNKNEEAISYYRQIFLLNHSTSTLLSTHFNLGQAFLDMNQMDSALTHFTIGKKMALTNNCAHSKSLYYIELVKIYKTRKQFDLAVRTADTAITIERKRGSMQTMGLLYLLKSQIFESKGDIALALENYKIYTSLNDSISGLSSTNAIAGLEAGHLGEIKQLEIDSQKSKAKNYQLVSLLLIMCTIASLIFIYLIRRDARLRHLLMQEKIRNRLSRDLHDDLGSTLSSINILSKTAQKNISQNQSEKVETSLQKINERSQRLLNNMSDIIWNIKTDTDTLEAVLAHMREYGTELFEAKGIDYTFDFPEINVDQKLSLDMKNNIYLIFKEAVNNLIKYADASKAFISVKLENKTITMTIEDNGSGFDEKKLSRQNGLNNMKTRAQEINAALTIDSTPGVGSRVMLLVPI